MLFNTLSGRLLLLTIGFVLLAEVLVLLPAIGRFRVEYLAERLERAQIASLALLATPDDMVEPDLEAELLDNAGVLNIVFQRDQRRELVLSSPDVRPIDATYDLRNATQLSLIHDALTAILAPPGEYIRVIGPTVKGGGMVIEVTLPEDPLRAAMLDYGKRILILSLAISTVAAVLLFVALRRFITRPIERVVDSMTRFQEAPEDATRILRPSSRLRELADAERALQDMQSRLNAALKQKDRLAALGGAVARISHDLRNMLTTAQLMADRIDMSRDPGVKRVAPKLLAAIDRAINLCERTLDFGRSEEPAPETRRVLLRPLVEDVLEAERLNRNAESFRLEAVIPDDMVTVADPDQLFRVLSNLVRNAVQAMESETLEGRVLVSARAVGPDDSPVPAGRGGIEIFVADDGPGLPTRAIENIFQPFRGSGRRGGTGLGLVIAAELVRGHGGILELVETSTAGTRFRIFLPDTYPHSGAVEKTLTVRQNSLLHPPESADR